MRINSRAWTGPFHELPWTDIADEFREMSDRYAGFRYMTDIVDSVLACGGRQRLAGLTTMHDLVVTARPVPAPPIEVYDREVRYRTHTDPGIEHTADSPVHTGAGRHRTPAGFASTVRRRGIGAIVIRRCRHPGAQLVRSDAVVIDTDAIMGIVQRVGNIRSDRPSRRRATTPTRRGRHTQQTEFASIQAKIAENNGKIDRYPTAFENGAIP